MLYIINDGVLFDFNTNKTGFSVFVIHKDIGSLFGVLGWKYILSKKISCGTVNYPEAIKNNRSI